MATNVSESSAVSEYVVPQLMSYVDPSETTAITDAGLNFNFSMTQTLSNYIAAKESEVLAWNTFQTAISTAKTDEATYLTTIDTYQANSTVTNKSAVTSAYNTWQSDLTTVKADKALWVAASEATWKALVAMSNGE